MIGSYPTRAGIFLVTNSASSSGSNEIAGHAGIIYSPSFTEESFPADKSPKGINGVWYYND